jgi:hypothetical protein
MNGAQSRTSLLERLRENETLNSARFRAAGHLAATKSVRCPKCGLYEAIVFWTPVEGPSGMPRFRCPSGCKTTIHYDPAEETAEKKRSGFRSATVANWILLPILLYVAADYFSATSRGQVLAAQLWATSQEQISHFAVAVAELSGIHDGDEVPEAEPAQ